MLDLIPPTINLLILLGVIFFLVRKPFMEFVRTRHSTLRDDLAKTQRLLSEAQTKYLEYSHRLQSLDAEISRLIQDARQEAEASKVRIVTEAKKMADMIIVDAKKSSEAMLDEFKTQVRSDLANQVMARAETVLKNKLTGDDRERIRKDFSKQVGSVG